MNYQESNNHVAMIFYLILVYVQLCYFLNLQVKYFYIIFDWYVELFVDRFH